MAYLHLIVIIPFFLIMSACGDDFEETECWQQPSSAAVTSRESPAQEGSFLVAFRADGLNVRGYPSFLNEYQSHMNLLASQIGADPRIKKLNFVTGVDLASPGRSAEEAELRLPKGLYFNFDDKKIESKYASIVQVDFENQEAAKDILGIWKNQKITYFAEPNYISQPSVMKSNTFEGYADFYKGMNQWWLTAIKLSDAFTFLADRDQSAANIPTDAQILTNRPIVAILDSGVDIEHPALKSNIWTNTDVNASRCSNDLHGCDTTNPEKGSLGNGDIFPFSASGPNQTCFGKDSNCAHGTHVAGIVAGDPEWTSPESGLQTPGVCPHCQVMVLKIVSKIGDKSGILDSSILRAFKYVALNRRGSPDVRVINASFGKFVRSRSVGLLLRILKEKRSTLVIGAAGNEDSMAQEYPAAFSDAVAVSAVDRELRKVEFSNFGRWVDVSAPGSAIMSTVPGKGAEYKSGTSMASPIVAGVAALMLTRYPDISFSQMRKWIVKSTDSTFYSAQENDGYNHDCYYPKIEQETFRQPLLGTGLLQASNAVQLKITGELPIYTEFDRVEPGCSVISSTSPIKNLTLVNYLLLLMLLLPVLLGLKPTRDSCNISKSSIFAISFRFKKPAVEVIEIINK
jgi:hypothetical protein